MKAFKTIFSGILICLFTLNVGCSKVNGKDTESIKAPNNENLSIRGTWKVEDINIIDSDIENKEEILTQKDSLISISNNEIKIFNKNFNDPSFKLKVVEGDYVLSYELKFKSNDFLDSSKKVDIISLIDSKRLIGEFIIINENNGYLYYSGLLLKLKRTNVASKNINLYESKVQDENKVQAKVLEEDYNDDVGVMLGLKTPRIKKEDGSFTDSTYRTLWISFKDNELMPILEKNNIIFPRLNGIWTIEKKIFADDNIYNEYFITNPIEGKNNNYKIDNISRNIYKDINFVANDYISIEMYIGENFNNLFTTYNTIPIDNINSSKGLSIEEIYSDEVNEKYDLDFNEKYKSLTDKEQSSLISLVDYTNFTIKRIEGKWELVGKIESKNFKEEGIDFNLSINPSKSILNYDTLLIPWKELKGIYPFIEDAYTSPTGRIAIIIYKNKLFVYEIEEGSIKGNSLASINLNQGESVIMAEWASGSYVDAWKQAFNEDSRNDIKEE